MKKVVALVLLGLAAAAFAAASRPIPLSELESLRRMDALGSKAPLPVAVVRDAIRTLNEEALGYLPVMPVLHVEDAVAGATLAAAETAAQAEVKLAKLFPSSTDKSTVALREAATVAAPIAAIAAR